MLDNAFLVIGGVIAIAGIAFMLVVLPVGYYLRFRGDRHEDGSAFDKRYRQTTAKAWSRAEARELAEHRAGGKPVWEPTPEDKPPARD